MLPRFSKFSLYIAQFRMRYLAFGLSGTWFLSVFCALAEVLRWVFVWVRVLDMPQTYHNLSLCNKAPDRHKKSAHEDIKSPSTPFLCQFKLYKPISCLQSSWWLLYCGIIGQQVFIALIVILDNHERYRLPNAGYPNRFHSVLYNQPPG